MSSDLIEETLKTTVETKDIVFGDGVTNQTDEMSAELFPEVKALVAADGNTFGTIGEEVVISLKVVRVESAQEPYIFPGKPTLYGDYKNIEILHKHIKPFEDAVVCSIGTGILDDIAKLASDELGRPYMNVCTAVSVGGSAALGASIFRNGFKITRSCLGPTGLIMDNDVVCNTPKRLAATEYGDLVEKIPAGVSWIPIDTLGIKSANEYVWDMVQGPLCGSLADPEVIRDGNKKAIESLIEGNLISGLMMQADQSSRSASGAGRRFSHVWEVEGHGLDWEPSLSHGFKIGIRAIASHAVWEEFLKMEAGDFDTDRVLAAVKSPKRVESQVCAALKPRMQEEAVRHSLKKRIEGEELVARTELLKEEWPELRKRLRAQLMTPKEVIDRLKTVDASYHPELIRIDWDRFHEAHFKAQMIRDRYAVFDILIDLRVHDTVVERLFLLEGFWGRHRRLAE